VVSWHQTVFDPTELPNGRKLITLRDAANYIVKLPKAEQDAPEWQADAEVPIGEDQQGVGLFWLRR
jgi:hypothetical protein